jgi:hypothetical protein
MGPPEERGDETFELSGERFGDFPELSDVPSLVFVPVEGAENKHTNKQTSMKNKQTNKQTNKQIKQNKTRECIWFCLMKCLKKYSHTTTSL